MGDNRIYKSSIADEITGFIAEKQAMGFKYTEEAGVMKRFDRYWSEHGYGRSGLTPDNLEGWCRMSDTEGAGSLEERVSVVRQFARYLNGIGMKSYVPPVSVKYIPPLPHLFTKDELGDLFHQIDSYKSPARAHSSHRIANEYPVLFRLIYLNGLRLTEACYLSFSEVDLSGGVITILDGKGNKDRLIYMAEDMTILCRDYLKYMRAELGAEPAWVFPGRDPEKHIYIASVEYRFNRFWEKTPSSAIRAVKPTVHDLRHTFVVDRINLWLEQGLDFNRMLPYLSKFLGHRSFNETFYYYHYAQEAAKTIRKMDTVIGKVIPEVKRR